MLVSELPKNALMFARYDGKPPRIVENKKGEMVPYFIDKNGIPIYVTDDKKIVSAMITRSSQKYRLYRTKPFYMSVTDVATGSNRWVTSVPWNYRKETVAAGIDKDNGETIYKEKITWYEDPEGKEAIEPTIEFLTGEKEASESAGQVNQTKIDLARAKAEADKLRESYFELVKKFDDLKSQNTALSEQVKELLEIKQGEKKEDVKKSPGRPPVNKQYGFNLEENKK
jgi:hypothetical protein